jgi:hypothetical protein
MAQTYHGIAGCQPGGIMACSKCGAKRGHMKGCPTEEGKRSTAGQKRGVARGHGKGLLKGEGTHECRNCAGTGAVIKQEKVKGKWTKVDTVCTECGGTGEVTR